MAKFFAWSPLQIVCTSALTVVAVKVTLFLLTLVPAIKVNMGG